MIILTNATIVELDPPKVERGIDIVIEGTTIKEVGKGIASKYKADKVIDLQGDVVSTGIVCSHNHFYSGLACGMGRTVSFPPAYNFNGVLQGVWWRLDRALDEESTYYSGLICALEAIKSGCTSVVDHHASPDYIKGSLDTLAKGFYETGLRGMLCYETTNRNGGVKEEREGVDENIAFANACDNVKKNDSENYIVEANIGGHAPFTISEEGLGMMGDAIKQTGRGVHIHVAEDLYDVAYCHDKYRKNLLERLDAHGILNDKALIVHGLHLVDSDIELLNERDSFLTFNSRSNMNNNVGYNNNLNKIKNLCMGTDGMGADMFEEFKFAFFRQGEANGPLWDNDFMKFLNNGNKILERSFGEKFGKIEAGYKADLTITGYTPRTPMESENVGGHMIYGMSSKDVKTVIVNGKVVFEDRAFPFDVKPIYEKAAAAAQKMWDRMEKIK